MYVSLLNRNFTKPLLTLTLLGASGGKGGKRGGSSGTPTWVVVVVIIGAVVVLAIVGFFVYKKCAGQGYGSPGNEDNKL